MMNALRMAMMTIRLVMRMKVALFFTFIFPCIFLFVYAGIFSHGNPSIVAYNFGPVLTLNIMGAGFWGLGLQSVMQRERGTLRRYRLAPISSLTVVASNLISNYLLQLPVVGLLIFCAVVFFHMPLRPGFLLPLWFLVTVGTFAFAGFGLTLASVANTMQEVQVYNNLVWFALLFLSGVTIPLAVLPHWIQRLATFLPATYLVSSFQAAMAQSEPMSAHWPEIMVLILSGFFGVTIAWKLFRWEKEERIPTSGKLWALALVIPFVLMGFWMNIYANPAASWAKSFALMERAASKDGSRQPDGNFVVDFENLGADQERANRWQVSYMPAASASPPRAELSLISPGANGTQHALRFNGQLSPSGRGRASVVALGHLSLPASIKAGHGIEFWIRSDDSRTYQVTLVYGDAKLQTNPALRLTPSHEWELVRLPAPDLLGPQTSPPHATPFAFAVEASGPPGEFSVSIDEIQVY